MANTTGNLATLAKRAFTNETAARELLEALRWPNGPACPTCGGCDPYKLTPKASGKNPARQGLYKCRACKRQFTVTTGSVFESSHLPLSKWLMAIHLMCASKKGISAHQLHRMLGITYRAAWFVNHRLRHAMETRADLFAKLTGIVEADETYVGGRIKGPFGSARRYENKTAVVALVERKGRAVAFPVARVDGATLQTEIRKRVSLDAHMMTDEHRGYDALSMGFAKHESVSHSQGEYVRGNVYTNTVEGFFSLLKRGITGSFHHVSKGHLHRYCNEFAFRHSTRVALGYNDGERAALLVKGAEGKRLTYKSRRGTRAA